MANDKAFFSKKSTKTKGYRRKKIRIESEEITLIFFLAVITLGVLIGSLMINFIDESSLAEIADSVYDSVFKMNNYTYQKGDIFRQSLLKYLKNIALIWLSGFLALKSITSLGVIFSRGLAVGFITGILIQEAGFYGLFCAFLLYFPQNIAFIGLCFLMGYDEIKHVISELFLKSMYKNKIYPRVEAIKIMLILGGVFLICIYEAYVCPYIYLIFG